MFFEGFIVEFSSRTNCLDSGSVLPPYSVIPMARYSTAGIGAGVYNQNTGRAHSPGTENTLFQ
jgi:hypothetical protein